MNATEMAVQRILEDAEENGAHPVTIAMLRRARAFAHRQFNTAEERRAQLEIALGIALVDLEHE